MGHNAQHIRQGKQVSALKLPPALKHITSLPILKRLPEHLAIDLIGMLIITVGTTLFSAVLDAPTWLLPPIFIFIAAASLWGANQLNRLVSGSKANTGDQRRLTASDDWMLDEKKHYESNLADYFLVPSMTVDPIKKDAETPCIVLKIEIVNAGWYPVNITSISGCFRYGDEDIPGQVELVDHFDYTRKIYPPRQVSIRIRQWISKDVAKEILAKAREKGSFNLVANRIILNVDVLKRPAGEAIESFEFRIQDKISVVTPDEWNWFVFNAF